MDLRSQKITRYFQEVQRTANLPDHNVSSKTQFVTVEAETLRAGELDEQTTNKLFYLAAEEQNQRSKKTTTRQVAEFPPPPKDADPIDLVISIASLETDREKIGLALLPASLDRDGKLSANIEDAEPWIPASRLHSEGTSDMEVMVGELAKFWEWRRGYRMKLASLVTDFEGAFNLAVSMFEAVASLILIKQGSELPAGKLEREQCVVSVKSIITANKPIIDLYEYLLNSDSDSSPLFEALLSLDAKEKIFHSDGLNEDIVFLKEAARRTCGSMGGAFPLTASQRRAVHAFMADGDGEVTAVSGPPGTGKTTMLQAVVATLIVRRALDKKPAPLILGTSTNNQAVTNIIDSFSSVTPDEPGVLDQRWLLARNDDDAFEDKPGHERLRGLAVYCPSGAKKQDAKAKGYLLEDQRKSGVYTSYSEKGYVQSCIPEFVNEAARYANETGLFNRPSSLTEAAEMLWKALKFCEDSRLELIEARQQADEYAGAPISVLEANLRYCEAETESLSRLLTNWSQHLQAATVDGVLDEDQDKLRADLNRTQGEPAGSLPSCADYVDYYATSMSNAALKLDRLKREIEQAKAKQAAAMQIYRDRIKSLLPSVRDIGLISEEKINKIAEARTLLELDQALDVSLRYTEFWLAVHHFEADWLLKASTEKLIPVADRWRNTDEYQNLYWSQVTSLTPCFVMTAYQVPKYFSLFSKTGDRSRYDLSRADLLIVDEAGQVDTSLGAAVFSVAKRALVVGDEQQLAPVWGIDPVSDEEMAGSNGLSDSWEVMKEHGLTGSNHSSVMRAASNASRWAFGPDRAPGLFLAEHFRCHEKIIGYCNQLLYKGLLQPSRPLKGYKLEGKVVSPFMFHEVQGSKDQSRGASRENPVEAKEIADWIAVNFKKYQEIYNLDKDPEKDKTIIGVVTPFAAQARLIKSSLRSKDKELAKLVTVGTAHSLQGAERAVVLFSSVYGDNSGEAKFIDGTLELMNVAVSRAKDLFIVFGGKKRWNDQGKVFSLVKEFATRDDESQEPGDLDGLNQRHSGQNELPEDSEVIEAVPKFVSRDEPGFLIISKLLKQWGNDGTIPPGESVTATAMNQILIDKGILFRDQSGNLRPTQQGIRLGIALYEGGLDDKKYVNPTYSPAAQAELASMLNQGELVEWTQN